MRRSKATGAAAPARGAPAYCSDAGIKPAQRRPCLLRNHLRSPPQESVLRKLSVLFAAAFVIATGAYAAGPAPATVSDTSKGKTLVDASGMTLYTFDKDADGKSACNGPCAKNWPPLAAATGAASCSWSIITREDGSKQWAYKGKP